MGEENGVSRMYARIWQTRSASWGFSVPSRYYNIQMTGIQTFCKRAIVLKLMQKSLLNFWRKSQSDPIVVL